MKNKQQNTIKEIIDIKLEEFRETLYMIAEQGLENTRKEMYNKYNIK